mmetsp:Transcript_77146/g.218631  ORF Transcript_77146/g.218631 Transcript_77146/m.218631 type:complete len:80 (-) Transcript_77146:486-725(-)
MRACGCCSDIVEDSYEGSWTLQRHCPEGLGHTIRKRANYLLFPAVFCFLIEFSSMDCVWMDPDVLLHNKYQVTKDGMLM